MRTPSPAVAALEDIVYAAIEAYSLPALSIAVAVEGRMVLARGYGMRNLGERLPADAHTGYSIASVSKQFAAAAVMRLVERGEVSLDDPLSRHLSWASYAEGVDLRSLLAHTSGIADFGSAPDFERLAFGEATPKDVARVAGGTLVFSPHEGWQYSNTAYVILAAVIERISGLPYHEFLARELLRPLGLQRTGGDELDQLMDNFATPYTRFSLGSWQRAREWHPDWKLGAGGLHSCVTDLVRWNIALRGGRAVSRSAFVEMTTPVRLPDGSLTSYGLGLEVRDVNGTKEVRHTGQLPGYCSNNVTYPDLGIDIVVLANSDGFESYYSIVRPILSSVLGWSDARREPLATTIPVLPEADVLTWTHAALGGALQDTRIGSRLRAFLTLRRIAALRDISRFGTLQRLVPFERFQNGSMAYHAYLAEFDARTLMLSLALRDGVELETIGFGVWYPDR